MRRSIFFAAIVLALILVAIPFKSAFAACPAYPAGVQTTDGSIGFLVNGGVAQAGRLVADTPIGPGVLVYNRTNNTLHLCNDTAWLTLGAGGTTAAGSSGQVQFNASGILAADTNLFWDNTNKRLGFGTATPVSQLTNNPTNTIDSATVGLNGTSFNWNQNAAGYVAALYNANTGVNGNGLLIKGSGTTTNPLLSVDTSTSQATAGSPIFRVLGNGNVGIGTANPSVKLEVGGVGNASTVKVNRANISDDNINLSISNNSAGSTLLYNNIGTAASGLAYRFHVTSSNTSALEIANNRDITVFANAFKPGGGAWGASSDARLKDIDGAYEHGLQSVIRLKTVRYHYKRDNPRKEPSDKAFVGLVAQDVRSVFPEAVSKGEDGYLSLDATPIHFAVINAIKDLKELNDDMRADNANLRELVEQQGRAIEALKAAQ